MSERTVAELCAPTLANIKTGSLFTVAYRDRRTLHAEIAQYDRLLAGRGVRMLPLRFFRGRALIYVYRPDRLALDLQAPGCATFLAECGYDVARPGAALARLRARLRAGGPFPHEIGLFLGYPLADVRGFVENKAAGYKCIGFWKVYGNEDAARRTFARFSHCTRVYRQLAEKGAGLAELTVPSRRTA